MEGRRSGSVNREHYRIPEGPAQSQCHQEKTSARDGLAGRRRGTEGTRREKAEINLKRENFGKKTKRFTGGGKGESIREKSREHGGETCRAVKGEPQRTSGLSRKPQESRPSSHYRK